MKIHTIEYNFDYQIKRVLTSMLPSYLEYEREGGNKSFVEWLWDNSEEFGKAIHERVEEWCGWSGVMPDGVPNSNEIEA